MTRNNPTSQESCAKPVLPAPHSATPTAKHGYTWGAVRDTQAAELSVGETFIQPSVGTAYHVRPDGTVYGAGVAWGMEMDGTAWTVTARDGDTVTARSHTGQTVTDTIPPTAHILRALPKDTPDDTAPH